MPHKVDTGHARNTREIREGHPPPETEKPMTHTQTPNQLLQTAVDQARKLAESGPSQPATAVWAAQAQHFGDLSVLALALRG